MSAASDLFDAINNQMRAWGYPVEEAEGCWSRSNGSSWTGGMPIAHTNHHFVIGLSRPFMNGANNVTYGDANLAGPKSNWYGGIDPATGRQRLRFIAAGPANHAGRGRIEVRNRISAGQAPLGWVSTSYSPVADNWGGGNTAYLGTEWHHPGDSTPWSDPLMDLIVALNTATCLKARWPSSRIFMHAEHSARKIDMSWRTTRGGHDLRAATEARTRDPGKPGGGETDWFTECFA